MTARGQYALDLIKKNFTIEWFTAESLRKRTGKKIAPATLMSLVRQEILVADNSSPKHYRLAGVEEEADTSTVAIED